MGIFWKLHDVLPKAVWRFLFQLYGNLKSTVRWFHSYGKTFKVTRGTRQGSRLSPVIFNVYINSLLESLSSRMEGVHLGQLVVNNIVFADDITLVANTAPDLQTLIDLCTTYSKDWRFSFNPSKSKCLAINTGMFRSDSEFVWTMNGEPMESSTSAEILGAVFSGNGSSDAHISARISKCRSSFYSLQNKGILHSYISPAVKAFIWKTYCLPVLLYAIECFPVNSSESRDLESCQGNLVKRGIGLSKFYRSSPLLGALEIPTISENVTLMRVSLYNRIMRTHSQAREIQLYFLSRLLCSDTTTPGTFVDRLARSGVCPVRSAFQGNRTLPRPAKTQPDGLKDSVRAILFKRYIAHSDFNMLKLLLKAF